MRTVKELWEILNPVNLEELDRVRGGNWMEKEEEEEKWVERT